MCCIVCLSSFAVTPNALSTKVCRCLCVLQKELNSVLAVCAMYTLPACIFCLLLRARVHGAFVCFGKWWLRSMIFFIRSFYSVSEDAAACLDSSINGSMQAFLCSSLFRFFFFSFLVFCFLFSGSRWCTCTVSLETNEIRSSKLNDPSNPSFCVRASSERIRMFSAGRQCSSLRTEGSVKAQRGQRTPFHFFCAKGDWVWHSYH